MIWKSVKKSSIILIIILIIILSTIPVIADTYEYNDYHLYSIGGTNYSNGAWHSNTGGPMSSFGLCINVYTNTWYITGGSTTPIPFPSGVTIDYTDRTTFLQTAYYTVNGNRYNFTILSNDDTSGNFYSQSIPASPYYPAVNVYLPTTGQSTPVPSTPVLGVNQDTILNQTFLTWTPNTSNNSQWYAKVSYKVNQNSSPDTYLSYSAQSPFRIYDEGYYNVALYYYVDGVQRLSDWSNTVHVTQILNPEEEDPEHDFWYILQQLSDAFENVRSFLNNLKLMFIELFDFLPSEIMYVFWSALIISIVFHIFIK